MFTHMETMKVAGDSTYSYNYMHNYGLIISPVTFTD